MVTLKKLAKLSPSEQQSLKELRAFLIKIKSGNVRLLALRDLADGYLARILSVVYLMNVKGDQPVSDDDYLWGMFDKNVVKDVLNTLYILMEELNLNDNVVVKGKRILKKYK